MSAEQKTPPGSAAIEGKVAAGTAVPAPASTAPQPLSDAELDVVSAAGGGLKPDFGAKPRSVKIPT